MKENINCHTYGNCEWKAYMRYEQENHSWKPHDQKEICVSVQQNKMVLYKAFQCLKW